MKNDKNHFRNIYQLLIISLFTMFLAACNGNKSANKVPMMDTTGVSTSVRQINEEINKDPSNPELYYRKARQLYNEKNAPKAWESIQIALELDSLNPLYTFHKGEILFALNKSLEASQAFEKTVSINPKYYEAWVKLGELYLVVKEHKKSLDCFSKAQSIDAADPKNFFYKGLNFKELRDTSNALISFRRAVEVDNNYFEAYMQLAIISAALKDPLALDYYNNALRINELSPEALYGRGLYYQEKGRFDEAVADYKKIISIEPAYSTAYYNIGFINFLLKKYAGAIENFGTAIESNPEYVDAYYMRGLCHEALNHKQEALNNYDYALQLDAKYEKALEGKKRLGN